MDKDSYGRNLEDFFFGTSREFENRWICVEAFLSDFDCHLIEESLEKGWSVQETVERGKEILRDKDSQFAQDREDFLWLLDHDMSMNG